MSARNLHKGNIREDNDNEAKILHWKLCKSLTWKRKKERWYEHSPEGVVENEDAKILWDCNLQLV